MLHETPVQYGAVAKVELCEGVRVQGVEMEVEAEAEVETVEEAEEEAEDEADVDGGELHAARTHCTWPLPRIESGYGQCADAYILEEDTQVYVQHK